MKISIIGTGAYGLALSMMFYENKHKIYMWTAFEEEKNMLVKIRKYEKVLPGVNIPEDIVFTCDLKEATLNSDLIVLAIPAGAFESVCMQLKDFVQNIPILIASKGIENESLRFLHEIVEENIKNTEIAAISGPTFAIDMALKERCALTLASNNNQTRSFIKNILENPYLKINESDDIIGTEICGAYKNVVAIASGILDGLQVSVSTKCRFLTDAFLEMKDLIIALGGKEDSILSYAGFGDFILTCTSPKSRNFTLGQMIGSKENQEKINDYIQNTTIEGLYTLKTVQKIMIEKNVSLKLIPILSSIIEGKKEAEEILY